MIPNLLELATATRTSVQYYKAIHSCKYIHRCLLKRCECCLLENTIGVTARSCVKSIIWQHRICDKCPEADLLRRETPYRSCSRAKVMAGYDSTPLSGAYRWYAANYSSGDELGSNLPKMYSSLRWHQIGTEAES